MTRKYWLDAMLKIVTPVLDAMSRDCLRKEMTIETKNDPAVTRVHTYLEAFGRVIVGVAPWLGCKELTGEEEQLRQKYAELARKCIAIAVDPNANDRLDFTTYGQALVDAAFLAQGILRAPEVLWDPLDELTKQRLIDCMRSTRKHTPSRNNWLLFSAMVECLIRHSGASDWDSMRIDYALVMSEEWYTGDGWYSDGSKFRMDYYNSFVIQPMLLEVLEQVGSENRNWANMLPDAWERASHYATHLEHMISPEGTFPLIGRSLAYRVGAFHMLSMAALRRRLEPSLSPAQVRCGLTAVLQRVMAFDSLFDEKGWLTIGVCGHQPDMGECYITTGSLYLISEFFLPLGLPASDPFWMDPDASWTMKALWNGENLPCEHAI